VADAIDPWRDLLFGLLALQNGLIDQGQLVAAFQAWTLNRDRTLADLLVERAGLPEMQRDLLNALVDVHVQKHGGDVEKSLAAMSIGRSTRERLAMLNDAMLDATLGLVGSARGSTDVDPERTPSCAVGAATSEGQRFHVLRPHARGGLGQVFVALDSELNREVALKQIVDHHADDKTSRTRFMVEAEITGRLEHPGIVPVYGLGTSENGRPYYAMKLIRGDSLKEAIARFHADGVSKRHPGRPALELRKLLRRFLDVCNAIDYAHGRGVLHRDIKPANIILGKHGETFVVDWGLAKATGKGEPGSDERTLLPSSAGGSAETLPGSALGTPAYMSPEQAVGDLEHLGPRSDVYSLGATLYCLLTGKQPFEGEIEEVLRAVQKGDFQAPRSLDPNIARPLEAVCLKAMALKPEERYATARALAEDIEHWMADEPVVARGETMAARLGRWGRHHKPVVAGAVVLGLATLVGLTVGVFLLDQEQHKTEAQRQVAVQQRALAVAKHAEAIEKAESLRRRDAISLVSLAHREYLDDNVALADNLLERCPADLREWEWSYARRLGHSELKSFVASSLGHDVWCVAFSPDGTLISAGTGPWFQVGDGPTAELTVRSIKTGDEVLSLRGLTGATQAVAFSPDGRRLAVARGFAGRESGAVLTVLDMETKRPVWQVAERGVHVLSVAYSADGRTIATGCGGFNNYSESGFVRLRGASDGGALGGPISSAPGGALSAAFSRDGRRIAYGSRDIVEIRDISSPKRQLVHQLRKHVNFVYAVAFSPDGRRMATGGWDKTIWLWDPVRGTPTEALTGHRGFVRGLVFSPDSSQLFSASEDNSVRRWDLTGAGEHAAFHGHTGFVHCVACSPDGVLCASGSLDGTVKLWSAAAADAQVTFRNSRGWVGTVAFSPDGRRVATAHNGEVRIWDPSTGEEFHRIPGPTGLMGRIGLVFSPDGAILAASGSGASVNLWDTRSWAIRGTLRDHPARVADAEFSRDGTRLVVACENGTIQVWEPARAKVLWSVIGHTTAANTVTFAPDGRSIASGGEDRQVKVWDATDGHQLTTFTGHATGLKDVAFSPDGRSLASAGGAYHGPNPAELKIWDLATGKPASLEGHTSLVTAVAFFPSGRRIASSSDDRTIKIWDAATGEDVFTLRGHTSGVVSLAISPSGQQLVSGSIDYTARIWSAETYPEQTAFEIARRRAAVERVRSLYSRHMLKADVLAALETNTGLSRDMRAAASEIAERRAESASGLYETAWLTIVHPTGSAQANRKAREQLEAACRVVIDDPDRLALYRRALALAYYRNGQAAQAIDTINTVNRTIAGPHPAQDAAPLPMDLAVVAMARYQLRQTADAQAALEDLRKVVQSQRWANDREAHDFLKEAEEAARAASKGVRVEVAN
jgi:WD40 repeat protein/tRNA A-37 threonylcarbamoyl transferase component Bud32